MQFNNKYLKYVLMDYAADDENASIQAENKRMRDEEIRLDREKRARQIPVSTKEMIKFSDGNLDEPFNRMEIAILDKFKEISREFDKWYVDAYKVINDPKKYNNGDMLELIIASLDDNEKRFTSLALDEHIDALGKLARILESRNYLRFDPFKSMYYKNINAWAEAIAAEFKLQLYINSTKTYVDRSGEDIPALAKAVHAMAWLYSIFRQVISNVESLQEGMLYIYNSVVYYVGETGKIPENEMPKQIRQLNHIGEAPFKRLDAFLDKFLKSHGGSFATKLYRTAANAYRSISCPKARKLKDGEIHPLCANWMGPGTDIIAASKYPSANAADDCAREHDIRYYHASKINDPTRRAQMIRQADDAIIKCLLKTNDPPYTQLGLAGIATKMRAEDLIPNLTKALMGKDTAKLYFGQRAKTSGGCLDCNGTCPNWRPYNDGRIQM